MGRYKKLRTHPSPASIYKYNADTPHGRYQYSEPTFNNTQPLRLKKVLCVRYTTCTCTASILFIAVGSSPPESRATLTMIVRTQRSSWVPDILLSSRSYSTGPSGSGLILR